MPYGTARGDPILMEGTLCRRIIREGCQASSMMVGHHGCACQTGANRIKSALSFMISVKHLAIMLTGRNAYPFRLVQLREKAWTVIASG